MFQYLDEEGNRHPIFSHDVNSYLQKISGGDYTAKDFRTWSGTVGGIELLPDALAEMKEFPKRNLAKCLVNQVAEKLGNTAAVCRAYYIHPSILSFADAYGPDLDSLLKNAVAANPVLKDELSDAELMALYLIEH